MLEAIEHVLAAGHTKGCKSVAVDLVGAEGSSAYSRLVSMERTSRE